ncbi:MAG: hypothetical protein AAF647_00700 [Pseudomonadota bacterium]
MSDVTLTPAVATALFVAACLSGMRYRSVWKAEGPRWQLWFYGVCAALALGIVAFIPMQV